LGKNFVFSDFLGKNGFFDQAINIFIRYEFHFLPFHKIWNYFTFCFTIIPKYRIVTVTIVTICDSVLWRIKAVTMRLVLESFKSLVLASSFWDFLWRPAFILQNSSHYDGHKCDHLWRFCDSLKAVTMTTVKESFKSPSLYGFLWRLKAVTMRLVLESFKSLVLAGFFWDFLWFFFYLLWLFLLFVTASFYITKSVTLWRSQK
jgi:hypothetical protein